MANGGIQINTSSFKKLKKDLDKINRGSETAVKRTASLFNRSAPAWVKESVSNVFEINPTKVSKDLASKIKGKRVRVHGVKMDNYQLVYRGRPQPLGDFISGQRRIPRKRDKKKILVSGQVTVKGMGINATPLAGGNPGMIKPLLPYDVKIKITKRGRPTKLEGKFDTPIFLARMPNQSGVHPYQRTGKLSSTGNPQIQTVPGPAVESMIKNENVAKIIDQKITGKLSKELNRQLDMLINK